MNYKILLCGCGQLGSRYLQGLLSYSSKSEIYVYDVSISSIEKAKKFILEFKNEFNHKIIFNDNLENIPTEFDLAIITTTADNRSEVISKINKTKKIDNWIIEKLIAQKTIDLDTILNTIGFSTNAFINTPRRIWSMYIQFKSKLVKKTPIKMNVNGRFGLACNAIHFIDLFSWLTDEKIIKIDCTKLNNYWHPSKRNNFWEVSGELTIIYSNNSILKINSRETNILDNIEILTENETYNIDENHGIISNENNILIKEAPPLQSKLTPMIVEMILKEKCCLLPSLKESVILHRFFLDSIQLHWNKYNIAEGEVLKIT
jgi:predicted dehydrogenase